MHKYEVAKIQVAVVGGSGYSGLELMRLLKKHPFINVKGTFNSQNVADMKPSDYQLVFLATPAEVSVKLAPGIIDAGVKVIDLSGAFRLKTKDIKASYQECYGLNHESAELVAKATYGLHPWTKSDSASVSLIANPGCYATAILMGLLPLLSSKIIHSDTIVIDAKSGTTGAGKKAVESLLFSEVDGECLPYKVGVHQHLPEIKLFAELFSGCGIDPFFTTSLLPVRRGIIAGVYAKLQTGKNASSVADAFNQFYANYPLVSVSSEITNEVVSLKRVAGTAMTNISFKVIGDKLYLFSCIDNLLKGAASQAVENFNYLYQIPATTGLDHLEAII